MFCDTLWKAAHLWFNLNHQYFQKYVGRILNLCNSAKSFAHWKKSTGDCKISKSAQVPDLPFEESFELKPGCWVGRCHSCPKLTQKGLLASHGQWILLPSHPKNSQNHPALVKANLKDHWSKEIWPPSSKLIQIRSFRLTMTIDFVAWPPKTQSKSPRTG
jgi:hypothetical protein